MITTDGFVEIYDASSNKLLTRGHIVARKSHNPKWHDLEYISTDGKWFFNCRSPTFRIEQHDTPPEGIDEIVFSKQDDYQWRYWKNWDAPEPADIYRDFGMDELDPEVAPLVHELNLWPGIHTVGSCCGHEKGPLWVQFTASNLMSLSMILNAMRSPKVFPKLVGKFVTSMSPRYPQTLLYDQSIFDESFNQSVYIVLMTNYIGQRAYDDTKRLIRCLSELREKRGEWSQ